MITSYDGQRAHNQMIDALVRQEILRQNAETERRHAAEVLAAGEAGAMMRPAYSRYWSREIRRARRKYGHNPAPSRLSRALLGAYGLMVLEVSEWWRWLSSARPGRQP